jgi:hypothetical protein
VGCGRVVLGPRAREARVLRAVAQSETAYSARVEARGHSETFTPDDFRVVRHWSAPPLRESAFYLVRALDRDRMLNQRRLDAGAGAWYLVGLDILALPHVLSASRSVPGGGREGWPPSIDWDLLNRMIDAEGVRVRNEQEAYWVARLAATLPVAEADPMVIGEPPTAPGVPLDVQERLSREHPEARAPRVLRAGDGGYDVTLWTAYPQVPEAHVVRWSVHVRSDGAVRVEAETAPHGS